MSTRLPILVMLATLLGLPAVAAAQAYLSPGSTRSSAGPSQPDSAGRAFIDGALPLAAQPAVQSDLERSSFGRTIEPVYCQILAGAYFSGRPGPEIPAFNYLPLSIRYGWSLVGSESEMFWGMGRNMDFLIDLTAAPITTDYGTVLGGPTFQIRKNYADPGSTMIPYFQVGFGFILNDAYRDETQRALGHLFEFTQQAEVGVRWMVAADLSFDVAFGAQHISNANLSNRNLGVNAFGGQIGLTYYFSGGRQR